MQPDDNVDNITRIARSFVGARRDGHALPDYPGDMPVALDDGYAVQDAALALTGGKVADPVQRDEVTSAYRSLVQETQESSAVLAALSTTGEGLLQLSRIA